MNEAEFHGEVKDSKDALFLELMATEINIQATMKLQCEF